MSNKEFLDYEGLGYLAEHINLQDGKKIVKKLRTGETTLTITDSVITTDSIIDIYSDVYGAYATSVTQSNGSLSITFPVQDRDLNIIVIVRDGRGGGINPTGNAVEGDVLLNKTFSNDDGVDKVGTMPNNGAVSPTALSPNGSYIIPLGYHNGNGVVSASPNTGTYSPTTRNAALDMGIDNLNRYVDTTGVPNSNTETYTASSRGASLDMGATNNYRYVNTNGVPNSNSGTYTFPANDTGGTKDLGVTNTYRYVNASNVYNKGKADSGILYELTITHAVNAKKIYLTIIELVSNTTKVNNKEFTTGTAGGNPLFTQSVDGITFNANIGDGTSNVYAGTYNVTASKGTSTKTKSIPQHGAGNWSNSYTLIFDFMLKGSTLY